MESIFLQMFCLQHLFKTNMVSFSYLTETGFSTMGWEKHSGFRLRDEEYMVESDSMMRRTRWSQTLGGAWHSGVRHRSEQDTVKSDSAVSRTRCSQTPRWAGHCGIFENSMSAQSRLDRCHREQIVQGIFRPLRLEGHGGVSLKLNLTGNVPATCSS